MAIVFLQQRQKQKYLILAFVLILILIFIVIWRGFMAKTTPPVTLSPAMLGSPKIEINFEILKSPVLKELQVFEKIKPFEGAVGRENPFTPY